MDKYHNTEHRLRIHDKRKRAQDSDSVDAAVRPIMKQDDIANAKEWSKELYDPEGLGWRPTIGRLAKRVEELDRENATLRELLEGADTMLDGFGLGKYGSPLRSAIADILSNAPHDRSR